MSGFKTVQLKGRTFDMLVTAKKEFIDNHTEWDLSMLSNDKIIFEAIRYYIGTGKYRGVLKSEK